MLTTNSTPFPYSPLPDVVDVLQERGHIPKEQPHRPKEAYLYHCPFHDDTNPSFSVHENRMQWKCWTCGGGGPKDLLRLFGQEPAYRPPKAPKSPKKSQQGHDERLQGCTLGEVARAKAMPPEHLRSLGWYDTEHRYQLNGQWATCRAVAIPYANSVQLRVGLDRGERFKWQPYGHPENAKELYGVQWLLPIDRVVLLVEGASDTAASRFLGIPAVGIPGTSTWTSNRKKWAEQLEDRELVVWQEPGEAAEKMVDAIAQDIPDLRVVEAPDGIKDVVELLDQAGSGAGEWLRELMAEAEPYFLPAPGHAQERPDVANREYTLTSLFRIGDKSRKSLLWESAKEHFPLPSGKAWLVGRLLYSERDGKAAWVNFVSNSWLNPVNAQHKRWCLYFNILPKINGRQLYARRVPIDDWSATAHKSLARYIQRATLKDGSEKLGWVWFDNGLARGYYIYLTNLPGLRGFEPVEDVEATLVDALRAISPPNSAEHEGRFRPYGGSDNWTTKVDSTGEEDKDRWEIIAVSRQPVDMTLVEAECVAGGIKYEMSNSYWRAQVGPALEMRASAEDALAMATSLGEWSLRRQSMAVGSHDGRGSPG